MVPTSWQDEALARDGVSREVPCSVLKGETVPDSLPASLVKAMVFPVVMYGCESWTVKKVESLECGPTWNHPLPTVVGGIC